MVRSTQILLIVAGLATLSATVAIAKDKTTLGVAIIVLVLACTMAVLRWEVRAAQERHRDTLSYAQNATNMGSDPTSVIAALHGEQPQNGAPPELPSRRYDLRGYQQVQSRGDTWRYRPPRV
jgi:hypothetical protein